MLDVAITLYFICLLFLVTGFAFFMAARRSLREADDKMRASVMTYQAAVGALEKAQEQKRLAMRGTALRRH